MAFAVTSKYIRFRWTGTTITLNTTNAPWLSNVLLLVGHSIPNGAGVNSRVQYKGSYNGQAPGGALSQLVQGADYEMNSGLYNGWVLNSAILLSVLTDAPTAVAVPSITTLSPASGLAGTSVTITGVNLANAYAVVFNNLVASIATNSATSITAIVPAQASSGTVKVFTLGGIATSSAFTVQQLPVPAAPIWDFSSQMRILSLAAPSGYESAQLEYAQNSGAYQNYTAGLKIDNAAHPAGRWLARVKASSTNQEGITAGSPAITVSVVPPTITSFSPLSAPAGATITIYGTRFIGTTVVSINSGAVDSFTVNSATQITAVLSAAQVPGNIRVTVPGVGTAVSEDNFIVTTASGPAKLPPPGDGLAIEESDGAVSVSGSQITGAVSYRLLAATSVSGTFTVLANSLRTCAFVDNDRVEGRYYCWISLGDGLDYEDSDPANPFTISRFTEVAGADFQALPRLYITVGLLSNTAKTTGTLRVANVNRTSYPAEQLYEGTAKFEIGGNSTAGTPKPRINFDTPVRLSLLGLPAGDDWALLACFFDPSGMSDFNMLQLQRELQNGEWGPTPRMVEVYMNGELNGYYLLTDKIKRDVNRVNLESLGTAPADQTLPNLAGGYLIEQVAPEQEDPADIAFTTTRLSQPYYLNDAYPSITRAYGTKYPKIATITLAQKTYEQSLIQDLEDAFSTRSFTAPDGYRSLLDVPVAIDYYFLKEFSKELDAGAQSLYWSKKRNEKLKLVGWDYDQAFGQYIIGPNRNILQKPSGLWMRNMPLFRKLFMDPSFVSEVAARWPLFKQKAQARIYAAQANAQVMRNTGAAGRNNALWQVAMGAKSHAFEANRKIEFMQARLDWMDSVFGSVQAIQNTNLLTDGTWRRLPTGSELLADGKMRVTQAVEMAAGFLNHTFTQDVPMVAGQLYRLTVDVAQIDSGQATVVTDFAGDGNMNTTNMQLTTPGLHSLDFIATQPVIGYYLAGKGPQVDVTFNGASVRPLFVVETPQAVPGDFAGVVGPLPTQPAVVSAASDPKRQYFPAGGGEAGWLESSSFGGIKYAGNKPTALGSQYYTLNLFARTESVVIATVLRDNSGDGGTGMAEIAGQTQSFDAFGDPGEPLYMVFRVPAGQHQLKLTKLLRQSVYVGSVSIFATTPL